MGKQHYSPLVNWQRKQGTIWALCWAARLYLYLHRADNFLSCTPTFPGVVSSIKGPFPRAWAHKSKQQGPAPLAQETEHVDTGSVRHFPPESGNHCAAYLINSECCETVMAFCSRLRNGERGESYDNCLKSSKTMKQFEDVKLFHGNKNTWKEDCGWFLIWQSKSHI